MRIVGTFLAFVIVLLLAGLTAIYGGFYNVAATQPHSAFGSWLLHTTMENSVKRQAAGITVPPLDDPVLIARGAAHFRAMCVQCHGAPGVEPDELGKGLTPKPPELSDEMDEWSPGELYWITKHGIKFTGMPAWGPTHSDADLWAIVAFLKNRLPQLDAAGYRELERQAAAQGEAGHSH